jgi:hypothetical protein
MKPARTSYVLELEYQQLQVGNILILRLPQARSFKCLNMEKRYKMLELKN